jgi:FMN phosphatase YigB (HAD superfamily)
MSTNGIRFYKPRQEAYGAVVKALGLKMSEVLFVAGSSGDVVGAADAGMQVVWNNHVGLPAKPGSNPLKEGKSLDEALADFL